MDEREVKAKLRRAIQRLVIKDKILLHSNASERSICHRLAVYLESQFRGYCVDFEYDLNDNQTFAENRLKEDYAWKVLLKDARESASGGGHCATIFPEIVIHKRGVPEESLLVVELKKTSHPRKTHEIDRSKIRGYLEHGRLGFQYGLLLVLRTGQQHPQGGYVESYELYTRGKEEPDCTWLTSRS